MSKLIDLDSVSSTIREYFKECLDKHHKTEVDVIDANVDIQERIKNIPLNRKRKIYISGPITGIPDYMTRFQEAEEYLIKEGWSVINPAAVNAMLPEDTTYEEYMIMSLCMLEMCDAIFLLEGWEKSKGARWEFDYADFSGKEFHFQTLTFSKPETDGWISVSDRLPEEPEIEPMTLEEIENTTEYIVMIAGATVPTTLHYLGNGVWWQDTYYKVTAWQPLPPAYITEGVDND